MVEHARDRSILAEGQRANDGPRRDRENGADEDGQGDDEIRGEKRDGDRVLPYAVVRAALLALVKGLRVVRRAAPLREALWVHVRHRSRALAWDEERPFVAHANAAARPLFRGHQWSCWY